MVEQYRTLPAESAGLKTVTVDGQSVTYGELEERLAYRQGGAEVAELRRGKAGGRVWAAPGGPGRTG